MCPVGVSTDCGKFAFRIRPNKGLSSQVVTLRGLGRRDNRGYRLVVFNSSSMEPDLCRETFRIRTKTCEVAADSMDLIALFEQQFSKIGAILARYSGNQSSLFCHARLPRSLLKSSYRVPGIGK